MSDTQTIKDKLDVVDLIGEYVQLKPAGIHHKGLCPFHHEKSPSFMVSRERQSWHCFGCSKGGDIFSFIQEIEGMEFIEALQYLAKKAGVPLTSFKAEVNTSQKNRIKEINQEAARFFHNFLLQMDAAKGAQDYIAKRRINTESVEEWQVGFISDQWDLLTKYLLKKGYSIDDLVASGLAIKKDGAQSYYDRFRGRIMFPIWDIHGGIVGFTGRVLRETENSGGKYVNTPQTLVYDKSRVVFGLNKAKQEIKRKDLTVLVEGQMDVIACHQAGMKNVVAASGTALTEFQVALLERYSKNIAMAFDADSAGQSAARRGIDIALQRGMNVRVILLPPDAGKDPDECIQKNPAVWFDAVEQAQDVMKWYFTRAFSSKDIHDPKQKQTIVNELLPEIHHIPYAVERDHWLKELSTRLGVDMHALREDMKRVQSSKEQTQKRMGRVEESKQEKKELEPQGRISQLLEGLCVLLVRFPALISEIPGHVPESLLSTDPYGSLYEQIKKQYTGPDTQMSSLEDSRLDILLLKGELDFSSFTEDEALGEAKNIAEQIQHEWVKKRRKEIQFDMERAEREGNTERLKELGEEFNTLTIK